MDETNGVYADEKLCVYQEISNSLIIRIASTMRVIKTQETSRSSLAGKQLITLQKEALPYELLVIMVQASDYYRRPGLHAPFLLRT